MVVVVTIPGEVTGKGRPRIWNGRAVTPAKTRSKEGVIASLAMDAMGGCDPLTGPVLVTIEAVLPVATSWSKKRRAAALDGTEQPTKKPDLDNVVKLVLDAVNGIVFADDAQITHIIASKRYGVFAQTTLTVVPS
ncbi:RusA family crossover junction endodeoxyribonuclease [Paramagnetospirillum magneticum]|uniref:Holliday junction resolvase n=1 Tax=Paramagnetospirillum magneticum (strain ATCC 700264 / AMB-1) TaxID=342108 RepID=Q2W5Y8_PARM1|nr:RusA family crossover junction endodeoxyribonuclease [Paramagnetospirillum magneticum]BAE50737.1 Holliday junction resolvase [Paramagnetospirillum magneticum AMB-1]